MTPEERAGEFLVQYDRYEGNLDEAALISLIRKVRDEERARAAGIARHFAKKPGHKWRDIPLGMLPTGQDRRDEAIARAIEQEDA